MENILLKCEAEALAEKAKETEFRHMSLGLFTQLPLVKCFTAQARENKIVTPRPVSLAVLSNVSPIKGDRTAFLGHIKCEVTETITRAWPLGAVGHIDHQLHVTESGEVMSFTGALEYDGNTVICAQNKFPVKGLAPFDISIFCNRHVTELAERIHALGHQSHIKH